MSKYDDPVFQLVREKNIRTTAGNGTVSGKFTSFANLVLRRARALVITAGTAAGHTVAVVAGTSTLGTGTLGTSTAGVTVDFDLGTSAVAAGTPISLVNAADIVGVADVTLEFTEQPQ